jgi:hypothetical protein
LINYKELDKLFACADCLGREEIAKICAYHGTTAGSVNHSAWQSCSAPCASLSPAEFRFVDALVAMYVDRIASTACTKMRADCGLTGSNCPVGDPTVTRPEE